ncbi:hypothetical protein D5W64_12640 [Salmonella enterica subsp. enterica serovar Saintpaul]|nr:hypothetical protein [Salmonella enterica subsp. enterica serovar Saintpaul]
MNSTFMDRLNHTGGSYPTAFRVKMSDDDRFRSFFATHGQDITDPINRVQSNMRTDMAPDNESILEIPKRHITKK